MKNTCLNDRVIME